MSTRHKWLLCWIGLFASAVLIGILMDRVDTPWVTLLFFANLFAWTWVLGRIVCPRCNARLTQTADHFHRAPTIFRIPVSPFKKKCEVCHADLRQI
jgi:hypothetical protein